MKRQFVFIGMLFILAISAVSWGQNLPNPMQIYRLFRYVDNARAGNIRWIEIWENYNGTDREWFILTADFNTEGAVFEWHYIVGLGNNPPIHIRDGKYQPTNVDIWNILQERNVFNNADAYLNSLTCNNPQTGVINGIRSMGCELTNASLPGYFEVRPPATSTIQFWKSDVNNFPVRYLFEAQGTYEQVTHRYELFQQEIPIVEPQNVPLNCFINNFPIPPNTIITMSNAFRWTLFSEYRAVDLESFFEENLNTDWIFDEGLGGGGRRYQKQQEGVTCYLTLEYNPLSNNQYSTAITATIFVEINASDTDVPSISESVIQSMYRSAYAYQGTIEDVLPNILNTSEFSGWIQRNDLTIIDANSAFITLTNGIEERYIVLDMDENQLYTYVRLFKRPLISPPFDPAQLAPIGN